MFSVARVRVVLVLQCRVHLTLGSFAGDRASTVIRFPSFGSAGELPCIIALLRHKHCETGPSRWGMLGSGAFTLLQQAADNEFKAVKSVFLTDNTASLRYP